MADQNVKVIISGENRVQSAIHSATSDLNSFLERNRAGFQAAAVAGGIAFAGITAEVYKATQAFAASQVSMAKITATLTTMGPAALANKDAIIKMSQAAEKLGFDNDQAAESITRFYQATGDLTDAQTLNNLAMDLARAKSLDLSTATNLVNQVLSGNGRALKAYQINIKETASPLEALGQLHDQIKGQAASFADTLAGRSEILKVQIDNLQKSIGAGLTPVIENLLAVVQPLIEKILAWTQAHPELTTNILLVAGAITGLVTVVGALGLVLPSIITGFTLLAGPVGIIIGIIVALGFAIMNIIKIYDLLKNHGAEVWEGIKIMFKETIAAIVGFFQPLIDVMNATIGKLEAIYNKAQAAASALSSTLKSGPGGITSGAVSELKYLFTGKAMGGPVTAGTPYVVGEQGPEMFIPNRSGNILPNGFVSGGTTVNIYNPTLLDEGMVSKLGQLIARSLGKDLRY